MLGQLDKQQIQNILLSQALGRLACTDGNKPYLVPVTYCYDGKFIYGQSNEGTKLSILRKNPNVCFEVDVMTDMANWQSVIVFGIFEELKDEEASKARDILFGRVFSLMTSRTLHPHEHTIADEPLEDNREKYVMYRIRIEEATGRFEQP
jgi:nitroimidazol reductase NimA-like FMN-containing flavoprotein (pyridoxamine 5'-phosphate oxidase superfamily)